MYFLTGAKEGLSELGIENITILYWKYHVFLRVENVLPSKMDAFFLRLWSLI